MSDSVLEKSVVKLMDDVDELKKRDRGIDDSFEGLDRAVSYSVTMINALSNLMIEKGIIKDAELQDAITKERDRMSKAYTDMQKGATDETEQPAEKAGGEPEKTD